ncbi:MAG: hypothetical protein DRJ68_06680 [Thermoprotei archaeon]|nr:MAG: hypothetical protein DRJ68_06680 [Thermoprotei archaeon]
MKAWSRASILALALAVTLILVASPAKASGSKGCFEVVDSYWGLVEGRGVETPYQVQLHDAAPGDRDVVLVVRVKYVGEYQKIANIKAELTLTNPFSQVNEEELSSFYGSSVSMGEVFELQFKLDVPSNASIGVYHFQLKVQFDSIYNVTQTSHGYAVMERWEKLDSPVSETLDVPVELLGRPSLTVSSEPIQLGNLTEVKISITNVGSGVARDLWVKLSAAAGSNIRILEGFEKSVGDLEPNETAHVEFEVYVPPDQEQPEVQLQLDYKSPYGAHRSEQCTVNLFIRSIEPKLQVYAEPEFLTCGSINLVTLTLRSNYAYKLFDVRATITTTTITQTAIPIQVQSIPQSRAVVVGHEVHWFIGDLEPYCEENLTLRVYVPPDASSVELDFSFSFIDSGGVLRSERTSISFPAVGGVEFAVSEYTTYPETLEPGSQFTLTVTLLNLGTEDARFLEVLYLGAGGANITSARPYVYVGDVASGSSTAFSLQLGVSSDVAPGTYTVQLLVKCKDRLHITHEQVIELPIQVSKAQEEVEEQAPQAGLNVALLVVVAVAAAAIGFFAGRRVGRKGGGEGEGEVE